MTPASKKSGLPDTVRRAVERTFQSTFGSGALTRERAQDLADDVLRHAEAGAARAGRGVREARQRPRDAATEVGERVRDALSELGGATGELDGLKAQLHRLERRISKLEQTLQEQDTPRPSKSANRPGAQLTKKSGGAGKRKQNEQKR